MMEFAFLGASGVNGVMEFHGSGLAPGAIGGAFIIAIAFLAGFAVMKRSGIAVCALLLVLTAGLLEANWLGFLPNVSDNVRTLSLALFGATALIFLSASIRAAKYNAVIGGVVFTFALVIFGMGLINFLDRIELSRTMNMALIGVGGFAVLLSAMQAFKGDVGARMILPGALLAIAAPFVGNLSFAEATVGASSFLAPGLFAIGILGASIVALADGIAEKHVPVNLANGTLDFDAQNKTQLADAPARAQTDHIQTIDDAQYTDEKTDLVIDSQLGHVLDYSGISIWDWSATDIDQSESLASLLGADSNALFTPDAFKQFIAEKDLKRFTDTVLSPREGKFDIAVNLFNNKRIRLRGAKAANESNAILERVVAFIEEERAPVVIHGATKHSEKPPADAAGVNGLSLEQTNKIARLIEENELQPAFQPIIHLSDAKTVGYEALARMKESDAQLRNLSATDIAAVASARGKSAILAKNMLEHAIAYVTGLEDNARSNELFIAINIAWSDIRTPGFVEIIDKACTQMKAANAKIVLELTEGESIGDAPDASAIFAKLKNAGAALAFDDFGAGFTSLSNLRKYDFDYLKIDKAFSENLKRDGDSAKIIKALAAMGADLGLDVILEGLESDEAVSIANDLGCQYGQGFALARPVQQSTKPTAAPISPRLSAGQSAPANGNEMPKEEAQKTQPSNAEASAGPASSLEANDKKADEKVADNDQPKEEQGLTASKAELVSVKNNGGSSKKLSAEKVGPSEKKEVEFSDEDEPKKTGWRPWRRT